MVPARANPSVASREKENIDIKILTYKNNASIIEKREEKEN
jgi:hypothetical protein